MTPEHELKLALARLFESVTSDEASRFLEALTQRLNEHEPIN